MMRSRIVMLVKQGKFTRGELAMMSKDMGGAGTGDADALKRKISTAFKDIIGYK
jgi:hypothetical protein